MRIIIAWGDDEENLNEILPKGWKKINVKDRLKKVIKDCNRCFDEMEAGYVEASIVSNFPELDIQK